MGSNTLGVCRCLAYLCWTLLMLPLQVIALVLRLPIRSFLPRLYHRLCLPVIGLDVRVTGTQAVETPTLFVSNHSSYLDISVLGALIEGSFIAKAEVAEWPYFGTLAKLQNTVFVARSQRSQIGKQRDEIARRLEAGDNLILFPEGTSSDGNQILPFKTALFSVATKPVNGKPLTVQPVSVTAVALDGMPLGRSLRPLYAWYGDMSLIPHLWTLVRMGRITVDVAFHAPVTIEQFGSRKALAEHCWQMVAAGVAAAVAGAHLGETVGGKELVPPESEADLIGAGALS